MASSYDVCMMYFYKNFMAADPHLAGGGKVRGQLPPWTCRARQIKFVYGFVFFRLSYFDYSDLQLFAIFIFEVNFSETYLMTSDENRRLGASKFSKCSG